MALGSIRQFATSDKGTAGREAGRKSGSKPNPWLGITSALLVIAFRPGLRNRDQRKAQIYGIR
jgi:hypothetical protein